MIDINNILNTESEKLKKKYFRRELNTISLIETCVDKSTIRAFHEAKGYSKKYQPLSIFRVWAQNFLKDKKNLEKINEQSEFLKFRRHALKGLMKYWIQKDGGKPLFHQFNKLIDLFFKCLPRWAELDQRKKMWIFNNTNVPLDSYSLDLLRHCDPDSKIPMGVSMGYVTLHNYQKLQTEIKSYCKRHPALLFDLYAWDKRKTKKRKEITSFELRKLKKRNPVI